LQLQEIPLLNRRFTCSNHQQSPILARLDRAFINLEWSNSFPNSTLAAASKNTSDHVPLVLSALTSVPKPAVFRFDNVLLRSSSFLTSVERVWLSLGPGHALPGAGSLCRCLKRVRAVGKTLQKNYRSPSTLASNCETVIFLLDILDETRDLSPSEFQLRSGVQLALHRHNALRALYWRQRAKIRDCVLGDKNSNFFHQAASTRFRKNQIKCLDLGGVLVTAHSEKQAILKD
jgi:hypothetical protein